MPHSSGGGSHGGGSHGGGHGGSGSSSPSGIQHKYYPGSHRYVYYVNKRPQYIYSKNDPTKINMQGFLLSIVGTIFFFIFAVVAFIASILDVPTKVKATYNNPGVVIQDNAGIITNSSRLYNELYVFYDKTGISPTFITVNNEDWKGNYKNLEKYAYDLYVNTYDDEYHWVIIYSEPKNADPNFNDWYFEGMQGDNTDKILTESITKNFNDNAYKFLLQSKQYTVEDAFAEAFAKSVNGKVLAKGPYIGQIFMTFLFCICFTGVPIACIFLSLPRKKYANVMEVPITITEDTCDYCGGVYVVGIYTTCPHCGAPTKPHTYRVDEDGSRHAID